MRYVLLVVLCLFSLNAVADACDEEARHAEKMAALNKKPVKVQKKAYNDALFECTKMSLERELFVLEQQSGARRPTKPEYKEADAD